MTCVVRPVRTEDLDALIALAEESQGGLTTLPTDTKVLGERVETSVRSLQADPDTPQDELYLFVLEDLEGGDLLGTASIIASVGMRKPFYNYRTLTISQVSYELGVRVDTSPLVLMNDFNGYSEIATLYLASRARGGGFGALLSKSRYLFMAAHPKRFAPYSVSEIRGYVNEAGHSPFWEAIGRHFFQMSFAEADRLSSYGHVQFISDLMPKYPIYSELLPREAQDCIGRPHTDASAAMYLLQEEGFTYDGAVDIFDGGPCLVCRTDSIETVRNATAYRFVGNPRYENTVNAILSAGQGANFRCASGYVALEHEDLRMEDDVAEALGISTGDTVHLVKRRR
jgi:arginine N-succinyltransferase